jgi:hypothetical protein
MNEREADRAEAVRVIADILADAYLRLRFSKLSPDEVDCAENSRPHVTGS